MTDPSFASDASHCASPHDLAATLAKRPPPPDAATIHRVVTTAVAAAAASLAAGAALATAALVGLRARPAAFVVAAVAAQVSLPASGAALAAVNGLPAGFSLSLLLAAASTALVAWIWRDQLQLCGRLLGVAAASLAATPSLVGVSVGITLVGGAAGGLFALLAAAGAANGVLVPAVGAPADAPACVWQPAPVGVAAAALCALAAAWTIATVAALRTFVAAGATAQWFAAPRGTRRVVGAAQTSFAAGAGPQLGTCAAAGAVTVAADAVRSAVDAATTREDGAPAGLLAALFSGAARAALALLEYLTRFALVAAAISGQPLLASGKAATTLLRRVALSAVAVWYVPPLVLHTAAGAAAVVWGGVVAAVVKGSVATPSAPSAHLAVGAAAGGALFVTLNYAASILLSVVEALFFLFAMDRAAGVATREDVASVLLDVPCGVMSNGDGTQSGKRVPPSVLDAVHDAAGTGV